MIKLGFIPWMQEFFNIRKSINVIYHIDKLKDKNHMIIDAEKSFDKIQHLFIVEMLQTMGTEGVYLNTAKAIYDKPIANVFNYEKLNAFLLRSGSRVYITTIIQRSFGSPSYSHQRRKINKRNPDQKRRSKYLIVDGSPPGSPIPGILQASTLEWVAISFSNA